MEGECSEKSSKTEVRKRTSVRYFGENTPHRLYLRVYNHEAFTREQKGGAVDLQKHERWWGQET